MVQKLNLKKIDKEAVFEAEFYLVILWDDDLDPNSVYFVVLTNTNEVCWDQSCG